jgi:hypothetical protein
MGGFGWSRWIGGGWMGRFYVDLEDFGRIWGRYGPLFDECGNFGGGMVNGMEGEPRGWIFTISRFVKVDGLVSE